MDEHGAPDLPEPPLAAAPPPPRVWGPWATLAWSLVIAFAFLATQGAVVLTVATLRAGDVGDPKGEDLARSLATDGTVVAWATILAALVCSTLIVAIARARVGMSLRRSLGWHRPNTADVAAGLVTAAVIVVVVEILELVFPVGSHEGWMRDVYVSGGGGVALWVGIVVAAPVFEELFFRGFLFEGLRRSVLGDTGTLLFTSAAFAALHAQYELAVLPLVLVVGLALGWLRLRRRSLLAPVVAHATNNLIATVWVALDVHGLV